jgi:shikimate dehydrogenase
MRTFGLIGYPLSQSFSKRYFTEKFAREGIQDAVYELFPLETIQAFPDLIAQQPGLCGLNVTIPYKEAVIPFLDAMDAGAAAIGAVNVIKVEAGRLTGYNSDAHGFEVSLRRFLEKNNARPGRALVLGTGGAAKAVVWVLERLGIDSLFVSRSEGPGRIAYTDLDAHHFEAYPLIINTTPVGMAPNMADCPPIPYHLLSAGNLLYDLVYNPEQTLFLQRGFEAGCPVVNGMEMLYLQAERAWAVWNQ